MSGGGDPPSARSSEQVALALEVPVRLPPPVPEFGVDRHGSGNVPGDAAAEPHQGPPIALQPGFVAQVKKVLVRGGGQLFFGHNRSWERPCAFPRSRVTGGERGSKCAEGGTGATRSCTSRRRGSEDGEDPPFAGARGGAPAPSFFLPSLAKGTSPRMG
nr:MAG: hypothetical protein [Microvirus sp.]